MKKFISLLLVLLITLSICGCKEEPVIPSDSHNISDLKLYIDNSYTGEDSLLYAVYKVTATDKDIEFFYYTQGESSVGSGATVTLNSLNAYYDLFSANAALSKPFEITELKSPSEGQLIEAGQTVEFVSAFFVSKNDIKDGGSLVLNLKATHGFDQKEEVPLSQINYVDSAEALARTISPDGLTAEQKAANEEIEEIDKTLSEKIEKELTGSWQYTLDETAVEMVFKKGKFTRNTTVLKQDKRTTKTVTGTYSIRNKVILVTLKNKTELRIPYTYSDGKLEIGTPKTTE